MKPQEPNELVAAIARENCVAFVGSGPSMAAGLPSWPKLLKFVLEWCANHNVTVPNESDIQHLIDTGNLLLAAEALRANMGAEKYFPFLEEVFDKPNH
jgi:hypothetical protein